MATTVSAGIAERKDGVTEGILAVVHATQFAAITFFIALGATGLSILMHGNFRTVTQWMATLGFVLAWAAASSGIYQKNDGWFSGACLKSLKWWATIFVPVAIINLIFTFANKS
ncbi:MAG: hypothetical protein ACRDRI_21940 [Pseudonocardiaceae bacterium]